MPPFSPQVFAFEGILTSTEMNTLDANIDEVRRLHKGSSQPPALDAGVLWLDDATSPWVLWLYDGADFIAIGTFDPTANTFRVTLVNDIVTAAKIADGAVGTAALATSAVATAKIATGAVTEAKIASGAVHQAQLSTDTGTVSASTTGFANIALPGGQYGFYPETRRTSGLFVSAMISSERTSTSFATIIALSSGHSQDNAEARQRYINASPPYDLGDGETNGFLYLLRRGSDVIATYAAPTPPWVYNGPTCCMPDVIDENGRKWRRISRRNAVCRQLAVGALSLAETRERIASPEFREFDLVEIDQAVKNADMPLIPHPFLSAGADDQVFLLDPLDEMVGVLLNAQNEGEELTPLLRRARLRTPLNRQGPPDVVQVRLEF